MHLSLGLVSVPAAQSLLTNWSLTQRRTSTFEIKHLCSTSRITHSLSLSNINNELVHPPAHLLKMNGNHSAGLPLPASTFGDSQQVPKVLWRS